MALRALVIGTGWAAEGHVLGLRHAGAKVVGLYGRNAEIAAQLAARLGVERLGQDWRGAITELAPDVVAIATTAAPHLEMAEAAAAAGCHIACEKPLALTAADARARRDAVVAAGVRHACAATAALSPAITYAVALIRQGAIGRVRHAEKTTHLVPRPDQPYSWWHRLADGGGILYNGFPHVLQTLVRITGGAVRDATGTTSQALQRAPVGPQHHDHRAARADAVDLQRADVHWRDADTETGFQALLRLRLPDASVATATIATVFGHAAGKPGLLVHGTEGTLLAEEATHTVELTRDGSDWESVMVPEHLFSDDGEGDKVQRGWNRYLTRFVRDIEGLASEDDDYPTFDDGYVTCQVIDAVRAGGAVTEIDGT